MITAFNLVLMTAAVLIDLWIVYYLINLERIQCVCALEWRRHFIIGFILLSILYIVASTLGSSFTKIPGVALAYLTLGVFNIYVVLSYVMRLERENCKCSESTARLVLKIIAFIRILIIAVALLYAVFLVATVARLTANSKGASVPAAIAKSAKIAKKKRSPAK